MKIYTGKGDEGKTSILGPDKLFKDDIRIKSYGTVDELNSLIGLIIIEVDDEIKSHLTKIQSNLFDLGSDLASVTPLNSISKSDVSDLEKIIDTFDDELPELKSFILPGGSKASGWLHLGRSVTRRAERDIISLSRESVINKQIIPWINRLSDLFFVWARYSNMKEGQEDVKWVASKK
ncbi:MAG: cob(I)yrinic acid a,c-diamide adenosyltransferase [Candidatus Heimdallarchaeota archaeon]|nr:cob(I)yrinic acid a,c-diamide adenosyltransferase [Candidatus Heimdallarchaeota archaeon]